MARPPIIFSRRWWRICWLIVKEAFDDRQGRINGTDVLTVAEDEETTFALIVHPPGDKPFVLSVFFATEMDARAAFRSLKRTGFVNDGTTLQVMEVLPWGR